MIDSVNQRDTNILHSFSQTLHCWWCPPLASVGHPGAKRHSSQMLLSACQSQLVITQRHFRSTFTPGWLRFCQFPRPQPQMLSMESHD